MNNPVQTPSVQARVWPVVVETPAHTGLVGPLSYLSELPLAPGSLVRVPLGKRETLGVVWDAAPESAESPPSSSLRPVTALLEGLPPLPAPWRQLVTFAASYYQRSLGEVALAALPPSLRSLTPAQLTRRLGRKNPSASVAAPGADAPALTPQQAHSLAQIAQHSGPFLLFGATGSGKTEVYLHAVHAALTSDAQAQALVLVPEINLTPQLLARFESRFGAAAVASLHSGLTPAQRLAHWLAAHTGRARIVLGTRMAVFAPLPRLRLIVVDEEHDPSYKQQEGARYSARDLAVYRGKLEGAKVILGSATPSLESWHHSRPPQEGKADSSETSAGGRYLRLAMPQRVGQSGAHGFAQLRLIDMRQQPPGTVLAPPLLEAISARLARHEQTLLLLNRRGYAPVLACASCNWKSQCPNCSAYRVFHKSGRLLRCHHCGLAERVPRACPACGNVDITPLGRGTQRLEESLADWLAQQALPGGQPPRLLRIDADASRAAGALAQQLAQVHAGEVDVLVGTQMIAKGHDFRRVTLVACLEADAALFSSDFRASERLFSLLLQAAGRAGRDAGRSGTSEMWIQTALPAHPLFDALRRHDYAGFAQQLLAERQAAGLPPFAFQALLRADARSQTLAQDFLAAARAQALASAAHPRVTLYAPVPLPMARVANVERAQLLVESPSRGALQSFLRQWQPQLHALRKQPVGKGVIRWAVDVDPLAI
ncbi:MAG: primosomal protein N' [Burkholderiaceae bacterium]